MHWLSLWHEIPVWCVLSRRKLDGDVLDVGTLWITKAVCTIENLWENAISPEILHVFLVSSQNIDKHGMGQHTEPISKSAILALCPVQWIARVRKSSPYNYK